MRVVDLLEHLLGLGVVGVLVRVVLEGQAAVALLDVRVGRLLRDLQELVEGLAGAPGINFLDLSFCKIGKVFEGRTFGRMLKETCGF